MLTKIDIASNYFTGKLPDCLFTHAPSLQVLRSARFTEGRCRGIAWLNLRERALRYRVTQATGYGPA